jgi:glycosyltransferase involved in cell wall biosynthesis
MAARVNIESGAPCLLTEHGIYTNERRIEVLMAPWLNGVVHHGLSPTDDRLDIREFWINSFESMGRACYEATADIVTLYRANKEMQQALGADWWRQTVIPNGIDPSRFTAIERRPDRPPTIAFIGRVTPIKDVKTFIEAAQNVRKHYPDLRALVLGPTDEDPDYARECVELVESLDLQDTVEFTGMVDIKDYFGEVDIVVLTSLSEAQPLIILEAGAAGIPCVTTDVGSCRELLEGMPEEDPPFGPGGIVTDLVAPQKIAQAIVILLSDPDQCRAYGEALRKRVCAHYRSDDVAGKYRDLYDKYIAGKQDPGV